uniref:DH domain-containing protein n=1 Tax=Zonotrichia albicollis TaxID=44394 RepID=A0A8D2M0I5_ZONAL
MLKLSIMSEEELTHIFGDLDSYIPLHEDLLASLGEATKPDGTVEQIGPILVKWLPRLHAYKGYCSNQLAAKALLDQKKQDRRVQDFLQRCLESPFSRKLDLWSFLDIPRSRLVKYPLLLKEILRHTPKEHPDIHILQEAISIIQGVLSDINVKKGESECQYYIDKLEYLDEKQKDPRIEGSKALLCHGELKNKNGHKLYVFLFQEMLVLTRPVTRNERQAFQVYRQPIPVQELLLEDLQDGDVKMGGSFRGAFGNSDKGTELWERRGLGWTETRDLCSQAVYLCSLVSFGDTSLCPCWIFGIWGGGITVTLDSHCGERRTGILFLDQKAGFIYIRYIIHYNYAKKNKKRSCREQLCQEENRKNE